MIEPAAAAARAAPRAPDTAEAESERAALTNQILDLQERALQTVITSVLSSALMQSELTARQMRVILLLDDRTGEDPSAQCSAGSSDRTGVGPGMQMSVLAHRLGVTLPTATGIVERLVEQRLVRREAKPADRRAVVVRLTDEGQNLLTGFHAVIRTHWLSALAGLGTPEIRAVARAFGLFHAAGQQGLVGELAASRSLDGDSVGRRHQGVAGI